MIKMLFSLLALKKTSQKAVLLKGTFDWVLVMLRMPFLTNKFHYFEVSLEIGFTENLKKNSTSPKNWIWLLHQARFFI